MDIPKFISPALAVTAVSWYFFFEWLRHRSYKKHIHTGFAPSTQRLLNVGIFGGCLLMLAAVVLGLLTRTS